MHSNSGPEFPKVSFTLKSLSGCACVQVLLSNDFLRAHINPAAGGQGRWGVVCYLNQNVVQLERLSVA